MDVIYKGGIIDLIDKRQLKQLNVVNNGLLIRLSNIFFIHHTITMSFLFLNLMAIILLFQCPSYTLGLDHVSERAVKQPFFLMDHQMTYLGLLIVCMREH